MPSLRDADVRDTSTFRRGTWRPDASAIGWALLALLVAAPMAGGCDSSGRTQDTLGVGTPGAPGGGGGPAFGQDTGGTPTGDAGTTPGTDTGGPDDPKDECESDADCEAPTPYCGLSGFCFECVQDEQCPGEAVCLNGNCVAATCTPGETQCNGNTQLTCNALGTQWVEFACPGDDADCVDGQCTGCPPGLTKCLSKDEILVCKEDGSGFYPPEACGEGGFCADGQCLDCYPGTKRCLMGWAQVCTTEGLWQNDEDCEGSGQLCVNGLCESQCGANGKLSNEGCDYWAVDMDNLFDAASSPYAVIVSNLGDVPSTITITAKNTLAGAPSTVETGTVPPGGLQIFEMPQQNMGNSGIFWNAIRVQSTTPVVAYQFNPLENVGVFSNDASLLLPTNTFGTEYIVVSRFEFLGGDGNGGVAPYRGSFSVVAIEEATTVTIQPTAATRAGTAVQAMNAGSSYTYTLQPYQVLNVQSDQDGADLTGTIITSDKPIGVFGGHEGAIGSDRCCADHLEQQLFPTNTWGKTYVASKSFPRGKERDYWRIVASENVTQVSFTPAVHPTITLNRGEWTEFQTDKDFLVQANQPVMLAQVLPSSQEIAGPLECTTDSQCASGYTCDAFFGAGECVQANPYCTSEALNDCPNGHACSCIEDLFGSTCYCEPIGDPALILSAPVEQFRDSYVFLTPQNYQDDHINIVAPTGASVTIDGTTLSPASFQAIPGQPWGVTRLTVGDGVHTLTADQPVGVIAYGYDDDVSYGYTAGLELSDL